MPMSRYIVVAVMAMCPCASVPSAPRASQALSGRCRPSPRLPIRLPRLCVNLQKRLVELLRVVEDGRPYLIGRPFDRAAVGVHLVGGVAAKRLKPIAGRIEEVNRGAPRDPMSPGPVVDPRLVHREDVGRTEEGVRR